MPAKERPKLVEMLAAVPDPRRQCKNLRHALVDVLALGFCGVLCGCDDFVEIEAFGRAKEALFRRFLGPMLSRGIFVTWKEITSVPGEK